MDKIRKNLERVETHMVASMAAVEGNLAAQGAALAHLAEGQKGLVEAVGRLDRAVNELHRSAGNLRASFSEYRQHSGLMFSHLKAAVFVMESSGEMRFQKIEARLDDLERRPPTA